MSPKLGSNRGLLLGRLGGLARFRRFLGLTSGLLFLALLGRPWAGSTARAFTGLGFHFLRLGRNRERCGNEGDTTNKRKKLLHAQQYISITYLSEESIHLAPHVIEYE
jgi:hypothetical protein